MIKSYQHKADTYIKCIVLFILLTIIQELIDWVFPRDKERSGRDADPSPPSSAVVKKE